MKHKFSLSLSLALILAMLVTSVGLADNLQGDDLTAGGNANKYPGQTGTAVFYLVSNGSDGCNADSTNPVVVTVSSNQSWLTINSPQQLSLTGCGNSNTGTIGYSVTSNAPISGVATVSGVASGGKPGNNGFNNNPGDFTVTVIAPPPPSDTTAPVISYTVNGVYPPAPDGLNGWYTSDVTVSWTVSDAESAISSSSGCGLTTINADTSTSGTTLTCSATSAGGTNSASVTIKRDATAPGISGSAAPAPNVDGWNNTAVAVTFSCSDTTSGIASCDPDQTLSGEGSGQSATGTAVDQAGNSATVTLSNIKIDLTIPSISGAASPAANSHGWNNTDVTVSFTCGDGLSGVKSCGPDQTLSGEGAGQSVTGNVSDYAGNTNSTTVSGINIDKTAPTASASVSPAANGNGWNSGSVTVSFSGSDGLSGIDSCDAPVVLSSEGAGQSASGTCTDKAGNVSAPATASNINIDKTAPSVSLVGGPADGASYYFGFVPAAPTCSASDALSGLDGTCSVSGYSGAVGPHTVTASASDKAGNSAGDSATYEVLAWTLSGFYQPVDMGANVWNTVKGGSTVPLKFEVFAGPTELTNTSGVSTWAKQVTCNAGTEDTIEVLATGQTSLRYDTVAGQFVYNWQTPKLPGKCYVVTMTTQDGSSISANFKLK